MMLRTRKVMMLRISDNDVEEEGRSQDRAPRFVRACAVEMRMGMSQEPFYADICS